MWKIYLISLALFFNGCSYFKYNATMCEDIASDPNSMLPSECKDYIEADATKAFNNTNKKDKDGSSNLIEFNDK